MFGGVSRAGRRMRPAARIHPEVVAAEGVPVTDDWKVRAALEGVSMSLYALRAIEKALARPSRQELLRAIREQRDVVLDPSPADVLRKERELR